MFAASGPHQGRLTAVRLARVDIRAPLGEPANRVGRTGAGAGHHRRLAAWQRPRTDAPAAINRLTIALLPLPHASDSANTPRSLTASSRAPPLFDQDLGRRMVVAVRGPVERGRAVRLGDVDVDLRC